jgi:hypothetical protein
MLDYTKELTSEQIWQDCFMERLTDLFWHLKGGNILPPEYDLELDRITPLPGMKAHFAVVASGGRQPLRYEFMTQMVPGATSFFVTPASPDFAMHGNQYENGYNMTGVESGFAAVIAADILVNYRDEIKDPLFDSLNPRARATRDWRPAMA